MMGVVIIGFVCVCVIGAPAVIVDAVEDDDEGMVFRDNWDYQMEPSKIPLLSDVIRNHTLPPTANGSVSCIIFL